jgi:hypothetical protein
MMSALITLFLNSSDKIPKDLLLTKLNHSAKYSASSCVNLMFIHFHSPLKLSLSRYQNIRCAFQ